MKRNIVIRMVCLLLCVSMLTPIAASATEDIPTPRVITTNKMRYVDQLFNHDGTDTDVRIALDHWLDMTTKGDQTDERKYSGYLMLEQEMDHQKKDGLYIAADVMDTFIQPVADTIASGGMNLVFAVPEKIWFINKFGRAAESAYPYYTYLCEIFLEYVGALQAELEEIDKLFGKFTDFVGASAKLDAELIDSDFVESARILKSYKYGERGRMIKAHNKVQAAGKIAEWTGTINSTYQYFQNAENVTMQQLYYMNALLMITDEYMQMLAQWRDQVDQIDASLKKDDFYESVYKKRPDIIAAIDAVTENVAELGKKTAEELAKSDQRGITSGDFAELLAGWAETISGIKGIVNGLMGVKKTTTAVGKVTETVKGTLGALNPIAIATSWSIGLLSGEFGDFDDATAAVTNLKKSLIYLLTNGKDGLLKRYIEDRNDANADAVINALNTMKAAKMVGENLWEDYYLHKSYGIFGPLKGKISSKVHTVFQNELRNREKVTDFDISESIAPVIGVYKDNLSRYYENTNAGPKVYYNITTTILGYYSHAEDLSYKGRDIEEPPTLVEDQKSKDRLPKAALEQLQNDKQLLKQVSKSWSVDSDTLKNLKPNTGYIRFNDLPSEPAAFQKATRKGTPQLSQNWENGGNIKFSQSYSSLVPMYPGQSIGPNVETGHTVYIDDNMWLYSSDGLEVILTDEEYEQYQALVKKVIDLWESGIGDKKDILFPAFRPSDYIDQQTPRIMLRTFETRDWIESFEMYDAAVDYSKHKIKHARIIRK